MICDLIFIWAELPNRARPGAAAARVGRHSVMRGAMAGSDALIRRARGLRAHCWAARAAVAAHCRQSLLLDTGAVAVVADACHGTSLIALVMVERRMAMARLNSSSMSMR